MTDAEAEEIAKDIYMHHFDDDIKYPDVLKAVTVGVCRGAAVDYAKWFNHITEAKEIIKDLLSLKASASSAEDVERRFSVRERAQEFLKESEK